MTKTWNLIWLTLASLLINTINYKVGYQMGVAEGWHSYASDSSAISRFHREADQLDDGDPAKADRLEQQLTAAWSHIVSEEQEMDEQYRAQATFWWRLNFQPQPFWNANKGLPRRLSRSQKTSFVEYFNGPQLTLLRWTVVTNHHEAYAGGAPAEKGADGIYFVPSVVVLYPARDEVVTNWVIGFRSGTNLVPIQTLVSR